MKRSIEIQGTEYPIEFGFGAFRILGALWKLKFNGVIQKISEDFSSAGDDPSFEQFETIGQMVWAAMQNAGIDDPPKVDKIMDDIMFAPEKLETVMSAFAEKMPQEKPGNPQPRKAPGKKAKK